MLEKEKAELQQKLEKNVEIYNKTVNITNQEVQSIERSFREKYETKLGLLNNEI